MNDLLHQIKFPRGSLPPEGRVGLLSFPVNPETGPFLVTSSKGLVWVPQSSDEGMVNAAFRNCTPQELFTDIILAVTATGSRFQWGNVHPLTQEGVREAVAHVRFYDPGEVQILTSPTVQVMMGTIPVHKRMWIPEGTIVVVPKDREFVGAWGRVARGSLVGIVHNAARGIAIATGATIVSESSP